MSIDYQNPWHKVSVGENSPKVVNAIIEIPKNTRAKYELDKETGLIMLDRVLEVSMNYPGNYGFVPQTLFPKGFREKLRFPVDGTPPPPSREAPKALHCGG